MTDLIEFEEATLGYRQQPVVEKLSFAVHENEFFGIVGANGSGKTTILRAMLGILKPICGRIRCRDGPIRFGYVPQRATIDELFPLNVREIVLMGRFGLLAPGQRPGARDRQVADRQLAHVGISALGDRRFRDLSGGQKQRALLARALAAEPQALLLDEPTDGMDLEGQQAIRSLIARLREERGLTVIYVTHRLNELANSADRLLLLHDEQVRIGPTAELITPAVLREVYGVEARVEQVAGKRLVVT